jgi:ketosteroid isomerase-like protein
MLPPMTSAAELIERFYAAFDRKDGDAMAACYAPDAHFSDPVFPELRGAEPGAMWRMLTAQAGELRVELLAHYVFSQTGRPVVNDIRATFRFADGLIAEHADAFSFHRWARQALGTPGLLLGWTPVLRGKVQGRARASLDEFIARDAQASSP